jgi:phytoene/squalene synthetase
MNAADARSTDALLYCSSLVAAEDEDVALALSYCDPADRPRALAVGAFMVELRRIPAAVSEPPLGEIRLQWQREALDEAIAGRPRAHPVSEALAAAGLGPADRSAAERLIDGRARLFYAPQFSSLDDLAGFLAEAEAPFVRLLGGAEASDQLERLAAAAALARFAPALASHLAAEAAARARAALAEAAPAFRALSPRAAGRCAFLALGPGHAARPDGRPWRAMKHLALLKAVASGRIAAKG